MYLFLLLTRYPKTDPYPVPGFATAPTLAPIAGPGAAFAIQSSPEASSASAPAPATSTASTPLSVLTRALPRLTIDLNMLLSRCARASTHAPSTATTLSPPLSLQLF